MIQTALGNIVARQGTCAVCFEYKEPATPKYKLPTNWELVFSNDTHRLRACRALGFVPKARDGDVGSKYTKKILLGALRCFYNLTEKIGINFVLKVNLNLTLVLFIILD